MVADRNHVEGGKQDGFDFAGNLTEKADKTLSNRSTCRLCSNRMPNSTEVVRTVLLKRFEELLGLDRSSKSEMLQAIDEALKVDWPSRRREIVAMHLKLANYERNEIVSVIAAFLWKIKEQIREGESCEETKGDAYSNVIKLVLSFCDNLEVEAYFVSSPDQFEFADDEEETHLPQSSSSLPAKKKTQTHGPTTSSNQNDSIGNSF
eukprot:scaffold6322_cov59-Cylindrotheca_fusiformis.AAC.12